MFDRASFGKLAERARQGTRTFVNTLGDRYPGASPGKLGAHWALGARGGVCKPTSR